MNHHKDTKDEKGQRDDADVHSNPIIGAAIEVHRILGPGLLESAYEQCLAHELELGGLDYERQVPLPLEYKGKRLDCGYRLDLIVGSIVIVEVKAVERREPMIKRLANG